MYNSPILVPPANTDYLTDAAITAAVERLLRTNRGVTPHLVEVTTHDGVVALSGYADSLLARQRTEEIARAVRGVRGVISRLVIQPANVPDEELQRDLEHALTADPATEEYRVRCAVAGGVVTLHGTVQSWPEKQLVLRVLSGVRGIRKIEAKKLRVRGGEIMNSDEEITTQIRELLDWDIRVNGPLVTVRTADRTVYLAGTVGTAAGKARVVATAYQAGAARVDARDLLVTCGPLNRRSRRDTFAPRPDAAVAQAVRDSLSYAPGMLLSEPLVQVHEGVVTLAGTVGSLRAKQAAERDARLVVGVANVHNLLKVRPGSVVTDANICQAVGAALARDPYVSHREFSVRAREGKVCLGGQAGSYFEWKQIGEVAAGVKGVLDVENRVEIAAPEAAPPEPNPAGFQEFLPGEDAPNPQPQEVDHALASRIRTRYFWSAALHDQDVEVQVEDGRATLSGTVDTWLDRQQAARDAYEAGARDVNNHLRVTTAPWLALVAREPTAPLLTAGAP